MKKSILTKIILAMVMLAMVFALVACGGNDKPDPDPGDDDKPKPTEPTFADKLLEVIAGASPILETVKGIKADSNIGAELALGVEYKGADAAAKKYTVDIKGNIAATNPELLVNYKHSDGQDYFTLGYKGGKLYLQQPLTAVNNGKTAKTDKVVADVTGLNYAVADLMSILMDVLADVAANETLKNFQLNSIVENEQFKSILSSVESMDLISIKSDATGHTLTMAEDKFGMVLDLLGRIDGLSDIMGVVKGLFEDGYPALEIKVGLDSAQKDKPINALEIGYSFDDSYGKIVVDLPKFSLDSRANVSFDNDYKAQALEAVIDAELARRGVKAQLSVAANPDLSADGKNLAYAELDINGNKAQGYFNGNKVVFDTNAVYTAINGGSSGNIITKPANTLYGATLQGEQDTIIKMLNKAAADAKANYLANKGKVDNTPAASTEPSLGILGNIYKLIGGDVKKLETTVEGKKAYRDPTEKEMLEQVDALIGDYVKFEIDTTSNEGNYLNTVKNIIEKFAEGDDWIIGWDLIKVNNDGKLVGINSFGDLLTFENWINMTDGKVTPPTGTNGVFGIVNWNTDNWEGGIKLSGAGNDKGLLDAVALFVQGREFVRMDDETPVYNPVEITAESIADFMNYYIGALGYYMEDGVVFTAAEKAAIAKIDEDYEKSTKSVTEKKKHKEDLKVYYNTTSADKVLRILVGYAGTASENQLLDMINGGAYLYVGSKSGEGIYGYIGLKSADKDYIKLGAKLGFVANTVDANAKAFIEKIGEAAHQELTNHEDKLDDEGQKIPVLGEDGKQLVVDGKPVFEQEYPIGDKLIGELLDMFYAYCEYQPAVAAQ